MVKYLLDRNIIVNYTAEIFMENVMSFLADVIDATPNISVITKIETLSCLTISYKKKLVLILL